MMIKNWEKVRDNDEQVWRHKRGAWIKISREESPLFGIRWNVVANTLIYPKGAQSPLRFKNKEDAEGVVMRHMKWPRWWI